MQIVLLSLSVLVPFKENPRSADASDHEALRKSIQRFGLFKPFLIWEGEDHPEGVRGPIVIGGNQRHATLLEAKAAGLFDQGPLQIALANGKTVTVDPEAIPCVVFPGSWAEAKVVALRDNAQEGEWDWDKLPSYMADLQKLFPEGMDLTLTGFDAQTLSDLEALGTDPLVGLDNFGNGGETPPPAPATSEGGEGTTPAPATSGTGGDTDTNFLNRQGAKVVIGNIRGKIPVALYERLATVIKREAGKLGTTDLPPILESFVSTLEKVQAQEPQPPAPPAPTRRKKKE